MCAIGRILILSLECRLRELFCAQNRPIQGRGQRFHRRSSRLKFKHRREDQTLISSARHVVYTRMVLDSDDPCSMLHPIDKKLPTYILFPPSFYRQSKTN